MVKDDKYFYISGVISLTIFIAFLFLFATILFSASSTKMYGIKKENYISISLAAPVMKKNSTNKQKSQVLPTITQTNNISNNIDVNDLFSDVWTQKIVHTKKPKEINSKRIQEISKRIKTSEKNAVELLAEKVENIDKADTTQEKQSNSSADEVNEYLAKIQAIIYDYFLPPMNSEGSVVKIVIEIDALGKMLDCRVLNYSSNEALNNEADKIKLRLARVIFPKNPDNRSFRAIINLIPENKE